MIVRLPLTASNVTCFRVDNSERKLSSICIDNAMFYRLSNIATLIAPKGMKWIRSHMQPGLHPVAVTVNTDDLLPSFNAVGSDKVYDMSVSLEITREEVEKYSDSWVYVRFDHERHHYEMAIPIKRMFHTTHFYDTEISKNSYILFSSLIEACDIANVIYRDRVVQPLLAYHPGKKHLVRYPKVEDFTFYGVERRKH